MSRYIDMFEARRAQVAEDTVLPDVCAAELAEIRHIEEAYRQPEMREILFGSFELMQQWYSGEIKYLAQPNLHQILKISEQLKTSKNDQEYDLCTYRVNLVPSKDDRPDQRIENNRYYFSRPGSITDSDWKPNTAFQLTTRMIGEYQGGQLVDIMPVVDVLFWGDAQPYGEIPNGHTRVGSRVFTERNRDGSSKIYRGTRITIQGELDNPQSTMRNLRSALITATPNVLSHRQIIKGQ